ncbi:MAG TPA: hypothetical protein VMT20_02540 [Terriglobia bacterium]|nr:hypothetical protein [Terriglobia bacterium]
MTTFRVYWLSAAAALWAALATLCLAAPSPQQSGETAAQPASAAVETQAVSLPHLQESASVAVNGPFQNPFAAFGRSVTDANRNSTDAEPAAAPAAYPGAPAPSPSSSSWAPTHFEIVGFVFWRNVTSNGGLTTTNYGSANFSDLRIGNMAAGPDFRFTWTPDRKILGATSKVWFDYDHINRSRTTTVTKSIALPGTIYIVNSTLNADLKTTEWVVGYAGRWGNEKFKIGPYGTLGRLTTNFTLTNLTANAPPPITKSVNYPNLIGTLGVDFDYTPVQQFDFYGRLGANPCCGGGWHVFESEFGAKYYFRRNLSVLGGIRYDYLKRDFTVAATEVGNTSVGPFSGFLKFPGWGPFVGASFRF